MEKEIVPEGVSKEEYWKQRCLAAEKVIYKMKRPSGGIPYAEWEEVNHKWYLLRTNQPNAATQQEGRREEAVEILKELCHLKKYKDTVGKDAFYERTQPQAWERANALLNSLVATTFPNQQYGDAYHISQTEREFNEERRKRNAIDPESLENTVE